MNNGNWNFERLIGNMDPSLTVIELIDVAETDETKWAIKDEAGNRTPFFENDINIVPINKKSCILVGQLNGDKNLYYVKSDDNGLYYDVVRFNDSNSIKDVNEEYAIISSNKGEYFFNKKTLKKTSDYFTKLHFIENRWVYEKEWKKENYSKSLIGTVSENGKIDCLAYYELGHLTKPSLKITDKEYDEFDNDIMMRELEIMIDLDKKNKQDQIRKILKVNIVKK